MAGLCAAPVGIPPEAPSAHAEHYRGAPFLVRRGSAGLTVIESPLHEHLMRPGAHYESGLAPPVRMQSRVAAGSATTPPKTGAYDP